jgi:hypothetical protein
VTVPLYVALIATVPPLLAGVAALGAVVVKNLRGTLGLLQVTFLTVVPLSQVIVLLAALAPVIFVNTSPAIANTVAIFFERFISSISPCNCLLQANVFTYEKYEKNMTSGSTLPDIYRVTCD